MPSSTNPIPNPLPESLSASGKSSDRLSLPTLQSKMKCDPEGYESELRLLYRHFDSSLHLFQQQASLNYTSIGANTDSTVAKDLGDMAMFLAHVTPFYPQHLSEFPQKIADLLRSSAHSLPSSLRCHLAQALILLLNRKIVDIGETLALFMELQILGDRVLRKLAFSHVVHSIRRMNQKHKNEAKNRQLQNVLFSMLQEEDESRAKRSLTVLCDLHRRRVWFDDRIANAICTACFHTSSRIMVAALSFLLGYERIEEANDSEGSSSEDDTTTQKPQVVLSREAIYKAHHKGTFASKKKKQAKLQRAMRSMKRQQRTASEHNSTSYYSPLTHLKDAQGFAEKLFSRLQSCNERFEVKMMMLKVIARTVGLHRLILLNFYPFLQKYVQPHQRDITNLLAAAVQACHDMVPPDAVEPLFRQIVNQFVHDRSRTEAIAVGLNVVREICLRMPLLMNEDLLQDLVLYKKSHEKAVSSAARSLITLFREVCPSLLVKKDRGRPTDPKARPKAFGEVNVISNVPGAELLQSDNESAFDSTDDEENVDEGKMEDENDEIEDEEEAAEREIEDGKELDDGNDDDGGGGDDDVDSDDVDSDDDVHSDDDGSDDDVGGGDGGGGGSNDGEVKARKRKFLDYDAQLNASDTSLRALKRLAGVKMEQVSSNLNDGILSNEDFQRIKELKAKKEAKLALAQHGLIKKGSESKLAGFKIPTSDQLSVKPVDPAKLEMHIRRKLSKDERLALVRAGREDRGKYIARAAVKQKKTGGSSNRQKNHKKAMPLAATRAKVARSRQQKKKQERHSGKQFRGRKAWK
ncbi:ARM repeat superfamily protein [Tasmannia lanceolata]|uniref:ARM repeat superfamily protein n=1 Tax=Tasmannia lanceolata TaxID=3420 RepID=UPI0040633EEE